MHTEGNGVSVVSDPLLAILVKVEQPGQVHPCCYCEQPLALLFGDGSPGLCGTVDCAGHKRRSCIDFPAMRCTGCGSALVLRTGGGRRHCKSCEKEFPAFAIPETYTKWMPQTSGVTASVANRT